jgi:glycosyltransferase involved in cell wall biosynthesis
MKSAKRILLYFPLDIRLKESGIAGKCRGIIHAFQQNYTVDYISASDAGFYLNDQLLYDCYSNESVKLKYRFTERTIGYYSPLLPLLDEKKYDALYFRFHYFITPNLILFLKKLRRKNPDIRIFVEIPTYPYQSELYNWMAQVRYYFGILLLPFFRKYVDRIVTVSKHQQIFGIPTINISNGYYSELFTKLNSIPEVQQQGFHIGMIANFNAWHGPDILMESLIRYYQKTDPKEDVFLHMIGDGEILQQCRNRIQECGLNDKVYFYHKINRPEILEVSKKIHVMVGTLGHHRKNIHLDSSLKSREYAVLGKPLILKTPDSDFPTTLPFVKYFPDDQSLLDVDEIILFFNQLKEKDPEYALKIHQYALSNLGWDVKLKPIFDQINTSH